MAKIKKFVILMLCAVIMLLCFIVMACFTTAKVANAETNSISVQQYTESDYLIRADGTLTDKRIEDFANEVKVAPNNKSFPELAQVIPLQYLETTETNAVYQPYL